MNDKRKKETFSSPIWGGRFESTPSKIMEKINASIDFDSRLYLQDITASKAHVAMLIKQKIISQVELDVPAYNLNNLPSNLKKIPISKPGSRFLK